MKRLFACTVALGLFAVGPTLAAPNDHHGDTHDAARPAGDHRSVSGGMNHDATRGTQPGGAHEAKTAPAPPAVVPQNQSRRGAAPATSARATGMRHDNAGSANSARSGNTAGRAPNVTSLRRNVQASHHFRDGDYRAPQGYRARRWSHGDHLPSGYFARNFWITNFLAFDLFAPPSGLVWVRVGNDALLIDEFSGEIVQVDYGVFY